MVQCDACKGWYIYHSQLDLSHLSIICATNSKRRTRKCATNIVIFDNIAMIRNLYDMTSTQVLCTYFT
ncbi:hypothetical protein Hanom_Chr17g01589681 [Helianthus anomalus]